MSETQIEQFIVRAVERDLAYARGRVRELRGDLERVKAAAQRIILNCDELLADKTASDE